jgi:hypothetical protein
MGCRGEPRTARKLTTEAAKKLQKALRPLQGALAMKRSARTNRDPRRGLPSLAEQRKTNVVTDIEGKHEKPTTGSNRPQFHVGQTVRILRNSIDRGQSIAAKIMKVLPLEGGCYQYRVKSTDEPFERTANERDLAG